MICGSMCGRGSSLGPWPGSGRSTMVLMSPRSSTQRRDQIVESSLLMKLHHARSLTSITGASAQAPRHSPCCTVKRAVGRGRVRRHAERRLRCSAACRRARSAHGRLVQTLILTRPDRLLVVHVVEGRDLVAPRSAACRGCGDELLARSRRPSRARSCTIARQAITADALPSGGYLAISRSKRPRLRQAHRRLHRVPRRRAGQARRRPDAARSPSRTIAARARRC